MAVPNEQADEMFEQRVRRDASEWAGMSEPERDEHRLRMLLQFLDDPRTIFTESKQRQEWARIIRAQSSLLQEAREALEKIERHHVALNKSANRPEGSSHTLAVARLALAKLSASASVAASPTQPEEKQP